VRLKSFREPTLIDRATQMQPMAGQMSDQMCGQRSQPSSGLGRRRWFLVPVVVAAMAAPLSCFTAPETCRNCATAFDAGPGGATDTGGSGLGTGGLVASGGSVGTGGSVGGGGGTGGGVGGMPATGGATSSGGAAGGVGGGPATGGAPSTGGSNGLGGGGRGGTPAASGGVTSSGGVAGTGVGGKSTGGMTASGGASGGGGSAGRGGAGGGADPDLVLWYKFDESSGASATDSAALGGTARNATLTNVSTGTATFSTTAKVGTHALALNGSSSTVGAYASLPSLQTLVPGAMTIALWVYVTKDQAWQRVFDFGKTPASGSTNPLVYMFLTTHQGQSTPASLRFAISTTGNGSGEQVINMTTPAVPSSNAWHHVAVTLAAGSPYTGTLYIDHVAVGTNGAMTIHPVDLGATDKNYLGRSQFTSDPYLGAMLDDLRVYKRALSAAEIAALP
jgi:hypothetical protein